MDAMSKIFRFMDLPREVRDQIYIYLLGQTYSIVPQWYNEVERFFYSPEDLPSLAILRVSKTVYTEAVPWIYSAGHLEYRMVPDDRSRSTTLPQNTPGLHMVQNINLAVDMTEHFCCCYEDLHSGWMSLAHQHFHENFEEFETHFGGDRIRRRFLRVTFKFGHGSPDLQLANSYHAVRLLTKMTEFKHVIIDAVAILPRCDDCPFRGAICGSVLQPMTERFEGLDAIIDAMKTELLSSLGPAHHRGGDLERHEELAGLLLIELPKRRDHGHCDSRCAECLDYYEQIIEFYPMLPNPSKKSA